MRIRTIQSKKCFEIGRQSNILYTSERIKYNVESFQKEWVKICMYHIWANPLCSVWDTKYWSNKCTVIKSTCIDSFRSENVCYLCQARSFSSYQRLHIHHLHDHCRDIRRTPWLNWTKQPPVRRNDSCIRSSSAWWRAATSTGTTLGTAAAP